MQIIKILTKPLMTQEKEKFIIFCVMAVLWLFMIISITITAIKTDSMKAMLAMPSILAIQLLVTNSYTEFRVASVKKELLKEFGKDSSLSNSSDSNTIVKNTKLLYIVVLGIVVLGIYWYVTRHYIMTLE